MLCLARDLNAPIACVLPEPADPAGLGGPADREACQTRRRLFIVFEIETVVRILRSLHHFAIEMPGGMAEDWHDYSETEEERQ